MLLGRFYPIDKLFKISINKTVKEDFLSILKTI